MGVVVAFFLLLAAISWHPSLVVSQSFRQLNLPPGKIGGESIAFEYPGSPVFYTGVRDGQILQYRGPISGWLSFAFTNPMRSRTACDNTTDPDKGPVCGYPLGLAFNRLTRQLIIADAYIGLLTVGPDGRLATPLATSAEGVPFVATNAVDVHPITGDIYFTDSSTKYQIRNYAEALQASDATGRLMKYDARTGQVTVLLRNLGFPTGVAVSGDGSVLLVSEASLNRLTRFWLSGPRANTAEVVLNGIVQPDNVRRAASGLGDFLIAARGRLGQRRGAAADQDSGSICVRAQREQGVRETPSFTVQLAVGGDVSECQESGLDLVVTSRSTPYIRIYGP